MILVILTTCYRVCYHSKSPEHQRKVNLQIHQHNFRILSSEHTAVRMQIKIDLAQPKIGVHYCFPLFYINHYTHYSTCIQLLLHQIMCLQESVIDRTRLELTNIRDILMSIFIVYFLDQYYNNYLQPPFCHVKFL